MMRSVMAEMALSEDYGDDDEEEEVEIKPENSKKEVRISLVLLSLCLVYCTPSLKSSYTLSGIRT